MVRISGRSVTGRHGTKAPEMGSDVALAAPVEALGAPMPSRICGGGAVLCLQWVQGSCRGGVPGFQSAEGVFEGEGLMV